MRTPHDVLNDNTYAGVNYIDARTAIKCMEDYAADKQAGIDELEYKLTSVLSNIQFAINECDNQTAKAENENQIKGMADLKKVLQCFLSIPNKS